MKALKLKFMSVVTLAIIAVLALVGLTGCASDGGLILLRMSAKNMPT